MDPVRERAITPEVLIVDDDEAQRLTLRTALEDSGFLVHEAGDGAAGITQFENVHPDVVLLDIMMPGVDGFEACRDIRERPQGRRVPIMMMTALDDEASILRAYELGATDFVTKPINHLILVHRINYVLQVHRHLSHYDELTGLPGRTIFLDYLRRGIASAKRHETYAAVLCVDLDNFSRVNDTFGHALGDHFLCSLVERIQSCVRETDYLAREGGESLARLGGDEFVVALLDLRTLEDVAVVVTRIRQALAHPFLLGDTEVYASVCIGVSSFPTDGNDPAMLLERAQAAMKHAKSDGRGEVQYYSAALKARTRRKFDVETALRRALEDGGLELHYQPRMQLWGAQSTVGMEALVRWRHPELGPIPASEIVTVAQDSGLILDLDEWVLESACAQAGRWRKEGLSGLCVSINLSAAQFKHRALASRVCDLNDRFELEPASLELEITEGSLLDDTERSVATLGSLREIGVGVSVDDFGTGYSSLSYLRRFPLKGIKIDQSFVRDLVTNADDAAIVRTIVTLGQSLRLRMTAEGVEDIEQLTFLRAYGCDEAQGFYFSRALPAREFQTWVVQTSARPFAQFADEAGRNEPAQPRMIV